MQMDLEKPRFRNDLVAQPIEEEGIRWVDVTDPNSGSTFRFYDVEYSIACAMDGHKDLSGLVEWTKGELGIDTNVDELHGVVTTLAQLGYLEGAGADGDAAEEFANSEPTRNVATEVMQEKAREAEARHADGAARPGKGGRRAAGSHDDREVEMDIDLSAHAKLTKEDVKEAVRASKVVSVPSVPKDLLDQIEAEADRKSGAPAPVTDVKRASGAMPLPKEPPKAAKPVEPGAASSKAPVAGTKSSLAPLLVFLLLALVGGGAVYYFYVYKPDHEQPQTPAGGRSGQPPAPSSKQAAAGVAAVPAGPVEASLAALGPPPVDAVTVGAGVIEWTAEEGSTVEKDSPVAKLLGAKRFEAQQAQAQDRLKFYQEELAKTQVTGGNNATLLANLQKKVDEKKTLADTAAAALAPLVIKAPAGGVVQVLVGKGAKVNAGDPVARINSESGLGATFAAGALASGFAPGGACTVTTKTEPPQKLACVVEAVQGNTVKVKLTGETTAKADDVVVLSK